MASTFSRVLVTGATGFIGGRLTERLTTEHQARVRALVRNLDKADHLRSLGVEVVPGDITDSASLQHAVSDCPLIIHCAALIHDATVTSEDFRRVNVAGTRNVLKAAVIAGAKTFIHLSSIGVYGTTPLRGTRETDPYQPCGDPYCDSKIEAEQVVLKSAEEKNLSFVIIRPANVYGPRSSFWTVALMEMIKAGKLKLIDDGRGMANHLYIDNLIDAIVLAAESDRARNESFIVSDGVNTNWKEFLGHYNRMLGLKPLPSISKSRALAMGLFHEGTAKLSGKPPSLSRRAVAYWTQTGTYSITKARTRLGYSPRIGLEEGMDRTERWLHDTGLLN